MKSVTQNLPALTRRQAIAAGIGLSSALAIRPVRAAGLDGAEFGLKPNSSRDQSQALQRAFNRAASEGVPLDLAAGSYQAGSLTFPDGLVLRGIPGATWLVTSDPAPVASAQNITNLVLTGIGFDGKDRGDNGSHSGLVALNQIANAQISQCSFINVSGNGLFVGATSGRIENCKFSGASLTGLFAVDSDGLMISGNTISDCGNGGLRVFRNQAGPDGTIISENRISNIRSGSGNGQNGNGINVFRADEVLIVNNHISDCDFSAVRVNTTNNTLIRGNTCTQCREVAIFSEFAFSGSIISDNIIDTAAAGISITNFNNGGRLAICIGNIVRNIMARSPTNPDVSPVGIFAEADAAISTNLVENVPGTGIVAGWGEHLRDVLISNNVIRDTNVGIGISVAPGAGKARVAGNLISGHRSKAIGAFAWREAKGLDLAKAPDQFANITVESNSVG